MQIESSAWNLSPMYSMLSSQSMLRGKDRWPDWNAELVLGNRTFFRRLPATRSCTARVESSDRLSTLVGVILTCSTGLVWLLNTTIFLLASRMSNWTTLLSNFPAAILISNLYFVKFEYVRRKGRNGFRYYRLLLLDKPTIQFKCCLKAEVWTNKQTSKKKPQYWQNIFKAIWLKSKQYFQ